MVNNQEFLQNEIGCEVQLCVKVGKYMMPLLNLGVRKYLEQLLVTYVNIILHQILMKTEVLKV